jgi:ribosomal protein L40E
MSDEKPNKQAVVAGERSVYTMCMRCSAVGAVAATDPRRHRLSGVHHGVRVSGQFVHGDRMHGQSDSYFADAYADTDQCENE